MENNKSLALLGFAAKAGKLSFGTHATTYAITSKKAKLVCAAEDISAKSVKELKFKASKKGITVMVLEGVSTEALSAALGKRCGIVAVNDESFSKAIIDKLESGGTAHDGKI